MNKRLIAKYLRALAEEIDGASSNPGLESAFSNPLKLEKGIVIYDVEDSEEGMLATRRAVDANWGIKTNPWALVARQDLEEFLEEYRDSWRSLSRQEKDEIDEEFLKKAWSYWKHYSESPKRIAFQNGKLLAFFANDSWWDKQDNNSSFYEFTGVHDPVEEEE